VIPKIDIRTNAREVVLELQRLGEEFTEKACARALNRTATTVRAEAARRIGQVYNIKSSAAKDHMVIFRAHRKRLVAAIVARGRPIPILQFDARQTRAGVTVRIKRGARKRIPEGFIATMRSGHRGVFIRQRAGGERAGRLPIEEIFSLSLPRAFTARAVMDTIARIAVTRSAEVLAQELRYFRMKGLP
jgi:hypothetical protein